MGMAFSGEPKVPDAITFSMRKFVGAAKNEMSNGEEAVLPENTLPEMLAMFKPFTLND